MPAGEVRAALIVATDKYLDDGLRQLRAPASDARELARILHDDSIGAFAVRTLIDRPHHQVLEELEGFFCDDRRRDDLLLLYFSCHGVKDDDGRLYFAASNTRRNRLDSTAIPADWIAKQMDHSPSNRIVLILDCCYSGAFARSMKGDPNVGLKERLGGRGRVVLTASNAIEYSFEGDQASGSSEPSIFTGALVHGLETGEADRNGDGLIDVDELYEYVYSKVRDRTPSQTPKKWALEVEGEFFVARTRLGARPKHLPADLQAEIGSSYSQVRERAVATLATLLQDPDPSIVAAARLALKGLAEDDSRSVSAAAVAAVGQAREPLPGVDPPPDTTPEPIRLPVRARVTPAIRDFMRKAASVFGKLDPRARRPILFAAAVATVMVLIIGAVALQPGDGERINSSLPPLTETTIPTGSTETTVSQTTLSTAATPSSQVPPTPRPTAAPTTRPTPTSGKANPPPTPPTTAGRTPTSSELDTVRLQSGDLTSEWGDNAGQADVGRPCGKLLTTSKLSSAGSGFEVAADSRFIAHVINGYADQQAVVAMREIQQKWKECILPYQKVINGVTYDVSVRTDLNVDGQSLALTQTFQPQSDQGQAFQTINRVEVVKNTISVLTFGRAPQCENNDFSFVDNLMSKLTARLTAIA